MLGTLVGSMGETEPVPGPPETPPEKPIVAVVGRAAFGVLAGLAGAGPAAARELYRGAPYGVGYFVGVWQP